MTPGVHVFKQITKSVCLIFLIMQITQPFAHAARAGQTLQLAQLVVTSTGDIDLDPPEVDHIPVASGVAGAVQSISVRAVDVQGIASVTLLYRASPAGEYKQVLMRQVSGTDNFTVSVDTAAEQDLIEYYFLVIDSGGNKVLNGFPYKPFSRVLAPQQALVPDLSSPAEKPSDNAQAQGMPASATVAVDDTANAPETKDAGQGKQLLWVVVGVLAVGLLAAGAAGSGGSDTTTGGAGGTGTGTQTVPVILNIPLPD